MFFYERFLYKITETLQDGVYPAKFLLRRLLKQNNNGTEKQTRIKQTITLKNIPIKKNNPGEQKQTLFCGGAQNIYNLFYKKYWQGQ